MKKVIDYVSDLHLMFYIDHIGKNYEEKKVAKFVEDKFFNGRVVGNALVIAGDVHEENIVVYWFLKYLSRQYEMVFYVPGNHEYYVTDFDTVSSREKIKELYECTLGLRNVVMFDAEYNPGVFNYHGHTICGDTMWYMPENLRDWGFYTLQSNDRFRIKEKGQSPRERITGYHKRSMKWYRELPDKVDLMISHVSPVANVRGKEGVNSCYYVRLPRFVARNWIYGHDHMSAEFKIDKTVFYSNPWGYDSKEFPIKSFFLS